MITLDVGCGDHPRGDVNCDLNIGHTLEGGDQKVKGIFIDPKKIPNFVCCDVLHLPFQEKAFTRVICFHVIEHVTSPISLITELLQVSKGEVEIRCPHRLSRDARKTYHRHYFDRQTFVRMLKSLGIDNFQYSHTYIDRSPFGRLSRFLPVLQINLPDEIVVKIQKS